MASSSTNKNPSISVKNVTNKPEATAEAIYVLIVDTLDPNLDWGTLEIGPTSADDVLTVTFDAFTGELRWFFDGINLPPNVNPPEGEGFAAYSITPLPGLPDGTVISGRAYIRFDYNPWLAGPEAGPLEVLVDECPSCDCPCHGDPQCDGVPNVLDVVKAVNVAFRGATPVQGPDCPYEQTDVSCDGVTNVIDVVKMVNIAFRDGDSAVEFCDPCAL